MIRQQNSLVAIILHIQTFGVGRENPRPCLDSDHLYK